MDNTNLAASIHLGKKSSGSDFYDPSLLVAVPRHENRNQYGIRDDNLPFKGFDVWHAYEFSALTENGLPFTRLMKMNYSCESGFIVESKSLKLYLNSFNMSRFGQSVSESLEICKEIIERDLKKLLKTDVSIAFQNPNTARVEIFKDFVNVLSLVDESELKINSFKESPELLCTEKTAGEKTYKLCFDSLRSNCRVTHQPDFGDVFICYKSKIHIKEKNLIEYLCSFRSEYHFHEECCEMIYKRLFDLLEENDELIVSILYTRRGGIDICPVRMSRNCDFLDVDFLVDINTFSRNGIKQ